VSINTKVSKAGYTACLTMTLALMVTNAVHAQSTIVAPTKTPTMPTLQADDADALFAHWDTDHNGTLSREEFRAGWQQLKANAELQRLHKQFVAMDVDRNGCLNTAEYGRLALIRNAGASAPPLATFDTEKNQCLDFKEYMNVVGYMLKQQRK
jgi:Ca2+-binding EF-hand superfamily protein